MIGVVATLKVQDGKQGEFEAVFNDLSKQVRANEPGNIVYQLTKSRTDPTVYKVLELYKDEDALKAHGGTDYFNQRSYSSYGYGNRAMIHWSSAVAPVDKRFMVYGDSFGNVPFTLFALCVKTCDELDMRHYRDDFAAYYQAFDPDVVVCLVNVQEISSDSEDLLYDFFPNG